MKAVSNHPLAWRLSALVLGTSLVASCGGGGGVGSGGTGKVDGLSAGTVTGFGSVIVDGTRFDDRGAATLTEVTPGQDVLTEARLGQRLEVASTSAGTAKTLRVEPAIVGPVSALAAGGFEAMGQAVAINMDASLGPVTQFSGYASLADVRAGDMVEVHGVTRVAGTTQTLQATRIEKRLDTPANLRVSGSVHGLVGGAAPQFMLGTLAVGIGGAAILPTGAVVAEGASVVVFAPLDHLSGNSGGSPRFSATGVRVKALRSDGLDSYASGVVSLLDTAAHRFTLDGIVVGYASASLSPAGATLANGRYVQARGMVNADGSLSASLVTIRDGKSQPEAELKGTVTGFDSVTKVFSVRDVLVTQGAASLEGCPASGLADGLFVEVEGSMNANGVTAKEIHCTSEGSDSTIEREGIAGSVDIVAQTFTLTRSGLPPVQVSWSNVTYFGGLTAQTLSGAKVEVEGVLVGGVLQAAKIKIEI